MKKLFTLLVFLNTTIAFSQTLIPDTLFGNGSINSVEISQENSGTINKVLRTSDDKILVCGYNYEFGCNCLYNDMVRFTPCGDVDSSFGLNGLVHHTFDQRNQGWDYALQPDGKILCTGLQSDGNAGSQQFPFIARYKSNGLPDSTFGTFGTNKISYSGTTEFHNLFLLPNGNILCNNGGIAMRFLPNGTVDSTFATDGLLSLPIPPGINFYYGGTSVLRTDGKIITANPAYNGNDVYSMVQAYDTVGHIDSSFGTNGVFVDYSSPSSVSALTMLQSTNKVIVGYSRPGATGVTVYRLTTTGQIDTTFGNHGYIDVANYLLTKLIPLNNDKFIIEHGSQDFHAFDSNGMPDTTFNLEGLSISFGSYGQIGASITTSNGEVTFGGYNFDKSFVVSRFITGSYVPTLSQRGDTLFTNVPNLSCTYQWFKNDTALSGAMDSNYIVTANGNYSVEVTNTWGCANTASITPTFSNIAKIDANRVSVYPNPANDFISVQFEKSTAAATLSLYDVVGKNVFETQVSYLSSTQIDVRSFSKGIYQMQVLTGEVKSNYKIIIQ